MILKSPEAGINRRDDVIRFIIRTSPGKNPEFGLKSEDNFLQVSLLVGFFYV